MKLETLSVDPPGESFRGTCGDERDVAAHLLPRLPQRHAPHDVPEADLGVCICANHEAWSGRHHAVARSETPMSTSRLAGPWLSRRSNAHMYGSKPGYVC